ncbi:MAG: hypothetical protein KKH99_00955, partial [Proteobacteria bacterium]|nr:hypothetical protein [Pseudomonadota bacterium]
LRWIIKEKPDYFEFYLSKNMDIFIREHDDIPPEDFDDYITFDDKFYFRFPDKPKIDEDEMPVPEDSAPAWELIEKMLDALARMDLSVFHGLLLETIALLGAEAEEEQFRLKNIRLAEKGFLPTHEAIGIYQPTKLSAIRKRPVILEKNIIQFDPDIPLPPQFFSQFVKGDNLLVKALALFTPEATLTLETEMAALINKVISADKIKLRAKEDLEKAIKKTCACLNLGLEAICETDPTPQKAKNIINEYFLEDIFRSGSRAAIQLTARAVNWFKTSFMNKSHLPLSFLGEHFLGTVGGLFLDRPLYFDNYASGELYRNFQSLSDIKDTSESLDQIIALDHFLIHLAPDISSFKEGILTYKTLILTLWAKNRLNLEPTLEPIPVKIFKDFFIALFSKTPENAPGQIQINDLIFWASEILKTEDTDIPEPLKIVFSNLIKALEDEYSRVNPRDIDPKFIPHFLLK